MVSSTVDGEYYEVNLEETEEPLAETYSESDFKWFILTQNAIGK